MQNHNDNYFIVFTDIKDFSKLTKGRLRAFQSQFNEQLYLELRINLEGAAVINTWGDAVFAAFRNGRDAALFMLNYRDFFATTTIGKQTLQPRIAASYGSGRVEYNYIGKFDDMYSTDITETSRLEPLTRPGEVFVTEEFKQQIKKSDPDDFAFDKLGEVKIAKSLKTKIIHRLRRKTEPEQVIDTLYKLKLEKYLQPIQFEADEDDQKRLTPYKKASRSELIELLNNPQQLSQNESVSFLYQLAVLAKNKGAFEEGLNLLKRIENAKPLNHPEPFHPFRYTPQFKKLKANMLTRLGRYSQASELISELWYGGFKNSDTLSMLAAQYKRQAIYGDKQVIDLKNLNVELIQRATALYIEAFRKKCDDYYPAINAAYLYALGGTKIDKSKKLATYIRNAWIKQQGKDWWLDSTLAETQLLNGRYQTALNEFIQAIKKHHPNRFELMATLEQIKLYSQLCNKKAETKEIRELLKNYISV